MWIELTNPKRINGVVRQASYRCYLPRHHALAHVANGDAVACGGPHDGRKGEGYPPDVMGPETIDAEDDDAVKMTEKDDDEDKDESEAEEEEEEEEEREDFDSEKKDEKSGGEDIEKVFEEAGKLVEELDLEEIKGVGPATADRLEDKFDSLDEMDENSLLEVKGVSEEKAEAILDRKEDGKS